MERTYHEVEKKQRNISDRHREKREKKKGKNNFGRQKFCAFGMLHHTFAPHLNFQTPNFHELSSHMLTPLDRS